MKTTIGSFFSVILMSFCLSLTGCTNKQRVKNKALVLAVEQFDNQVQETAKAQFVDQALQKGFVDLTRENTKIDVESIDLKSDTEATAQLTIESFPMSLVEELKKTPIKDWKGKMAAAKQKKTYTLKLQKIEGTWKILEQNENPQ